MNSPTGSVIPRDLLSNLPASGVDLNSYQLEGTFQTGSDGLEQLPPPVDVGLPVEAPPDFTALSFSDSGFDSILPVDLVTTDSVDSAQPLLGSSDEVPLVGSIADFDLTSAASTAFNPIGTPPPGTPIVIEAEDFGALVNYRVENQGVASGGQVLQNLGGDGTVATAQVAFNGPSGAYDIEVEVFDENDGRSQMRVLLNGQPLSSDAVWTMDAQLGSSGVSSSNRVIRSVGSNITLGPTDVITLEGTRNGGELARFDLIRFIPR